MRVLALAVVVVTGVLAVAALLAVPGTGEPEPRLPDGRAVVVDTAVEPRHHLFADAVTARADVVVDRRQVDPGTVTLDTRFDPYEPLGSTREERLDVGRLTRLRFTYRLRCLQVECLLPRHRRGFSFASGAVLAGAERVSAVEWPRITMAPRVAPEAPGAEAGTAPSWRLSPTDVSAPSFRVPPTLAVVLLAGLGGVLVGAAALILFLAFRPARPREAQPPSLERALLLLRDARRRAEPEEERKALDFLALELALRGEGDLARTASELAWARLHPDHEATDRLSEEVDQLVQRNGGRPRA